MEKFLDGNTGYALMHNHINEMVPGEKISEEALIALGITGSYHPKPGAEPKKEAVERAASFLLSGFSNPNARDPNYNILINNGDKTFTRK